MIFPLDSEFQVLTHYAHCTSWAKMWMALQVAISVPGIKATLSDTEYDLLSSIASDNFKEEQSIPTSAQWLEEQHLQAQPTTARYAFPYQDSPHSPNTTATARYYYSRHLALSSLPDLNSWFHFIEAFLVLV